MLLGFAWVAYSWIKLNLNVYEINKGKEIDLSTRKECKAELIQEVKVSSQNKLRLRS